MGAVAVRDNVSRFSLQPLLHFPKNQVKTFQIDLPMKPVENFNKPAHMSPFELVRQVDIHINLGNSFLGLFFPVQHFHWIRNGFNSDLTDVDTPVVVQILDVFHAQVSKTDREYIEVFSYERNDYYVRII